MNPEVMSTAQLMSAFAKNLEGEGFEDDFIDKALLTVLPQLVRDGLAITEPE